MLTFPNAKINIGLNITEKRTDGFHTIESVFYPVGWCDALEIVPSDTFLFESSGLPIPGEQTNNLIYKALHLIEQQEGKSFQNMLIHLHKVIPMGAGLGGGSADGAFALKMLNNFLGLGYSTSTLQALARQLGSDCAFFIENKPVFCYEKGDFFEPTTLNLKGKYIYLVNPEIHISTAEAYSGITPRHWATPLKEAIQQPISEWKTSIKNDFEDKLLEKYPKIATLKNQLYESGAVYASMTGSGSTVYGIFEEPPVSPLLFENCMIWHGELE